MASAACGVAAARGDPGYADLVEIGRGGDSVVYKARDLAVERDVAINMA